MINVELAGPGRLVMAEFGHLRQLLAAEMNLAKTASRGWEDAGAQARWFLHHREDSFGSGFAANYEATWRYKQEMLYNLKGVYASREADIKSVALLREMNNVIVNDDDIGAPDSADEDKKDDRVFAFGLAVLAWTKWVRKEMIAAGDTYEVVMARDRGDDAPETQQLNSLVYRFLARADEPIEQEPTFFEKNGLRG